MAILNILQVKQESLTLKIFVGTSFIEQMEIKLPTVNISAYKHQGNS